MFDINNSNFSGEPLCESCIFNCGPLDPSDMDHNYCSIYGMVQNVGVCPRYYMKRKEENEDINK